MANTVILQSAPDARPEAVGTALESVRAWARASGFEHRLIGDSLFDRISAAARAAAAGRPAMAADLARLRWIDETLRAGHGCAVWIDADVLVVDPAALRIETRDGALLGREFWVEADGAGRPRVRRNVHNALLAFTEEGRWLLDFYARTAERVLLAAGPRVPQQLIGPKLLGALHNLAGLPLTDAVGMASPLVLRDLAAGGGPAWAALTAAYRGAGASSPAAYNLCTSLLGRCVDGVEVSAELMSAAVAKLVADGYDGARADGAGGA